MRIPVWKMVLIGLLPSLMKIAFYRLRGAKIGRNVKIGLFSVIIADRIEIGDDCTFGIMSFIKCDSFRMGNRSVIGSMVAIDTPIVEIGHDSQIMEQTVIGGMKSPRSRIFIGSRVKIFPFCFLNPTEPITISDEAGIGGSNYIFTHGSWQSALDGFPVAFGPVVIGKGVWLPWRVFILPNVEIGEYATIAAGAVINKNIPPKSLAAGVPARIVSTDGAHLKVIDQSDRIALLKDILGELRDWLHYCGWQITPCSAGRDSWLLRAPSARGESFTLHVRYRNDDPLPISVTAATALVSLVGIDDGTAEYLIQAGTTWFDLAGKTAWPGNEYLFNEIRSFFSRYGIRFEISGEEPFVSAFPQT
jgi:acetyltransferase-like isoleucine patch superfamily enzyme